MTIDVKGHKVQIDQEDLELISQYKWHIGSTGYAVWRGVKDGKKQTIRMHRLITGCPDGLIVDHKNHDQLDNRRKNLRICTQSENMRNLSNQGKGYWFQKQNQRWVVEIYGKNVGSFSTEEQAIEIAALVRRGGTYVKPERTHCTHGHSLEDAYMYGRTKLCRTCQSIRSKAYFKRSYVAKPRTLVTICSRGHDKSIEGTNNGYCRKCARITAKLWRERQQNERKT